MVMQAGRIVLKYSEIAHLDADNALSTDWLPINKKIWKKNDICILILITFVHF